MNYQKLDAALAIALNDVQNPDAPELQVFIHTESVLDPTATAILESFGISNVNTGKDVFTAILSLNAISELSDRSWVKYLKLSQKLHLINARPSIKKLGM